MSIAAFILGFFMVVFMILAIIFAVRLYMNGIALFPESSRLSSSNSDTMSALSDQSPVQNQGKDEPDKDDNPYGTKPGECTACIKVTRKGNCGGIGI